jgi:hypothetical protein
MADPLTRLRKHSRVEHVDDERAIGNGVIVTLRQGWTFEPGVDNRVRGEDTALGALLTVKLSWPFAGPYDP